MDINNSLLTNAETLLSIASQLALQQQAPSESQLFNQVSTEINRFKEKVNAENDDASTINDACFFICALLDEIILKKQWEQKSFINLLQIQTKPFFQTLNRLMENPKANIDLLELAYLCLNLGYEGQYREASKRQQFTQILDHLYHKIETVRGKVHENALLSLNGKKSKSPWRLPPIWLTASATMLILITIFIPYHKRLNHDAKQTLHAIQILHKGTQS